MPRAFKKKQNKAFNFNSQRQQPRRQQQKRSEKSKNLSRILVWEVTGFKPTLSRHALLSFLQQKSGIPSINPKEYRKTDVEASFLIENPSVVERIVKLNGSRTPDGAILSIILDPDFINPNDPVIRALSNYIDSKFNRDIQLVDLSNLSDRIQGNRVNPNFGDAKFITKLIFALKYKAPGTKSLLLGENRIKSLSNFTKLHDMLPELCQLSLENNLLNHANELDHLKTCPIQSLIVRGNPFCQFKSRVELEADVRARFPNLTDLDSVPVAQIQFGNIALAGAQLPTSSGSYFAPPLDSSQYTNFLQGYFDMMDGQRQMIGTLYNPTATLTYTCDHQLFPSARIDPQWEKFTQGARNIVQNPDPTHCINTLYAQQGRITELLTAFPPSKHLIQHIDTAALTLPFALQDGSLQSQDLISITVSGTVTHADQKQQKEFKRGFSRTFLLAPSPETSLGVSILTDHYTLFALPPEMHTRPSTVPPLTPEQLNAIQALVQATGLKVEYAHQCLEASGYRLQDAIGLYDQLRAQNSLPPFYFTSQPLR